MQTTIHIIGHELRPGIPFFANAHRWKSRSSYLVGFSVRDLDFQGPYAPGFHLFPGGEWHNEQPFWWQSLVSHELRRRQCRDKYEVWELQCGKTLAIADTRDGLRFLKVTQDNPELIPPPAAEVAKYLHERASAMAHGEGRGLNWVRQSLRAIYTHTGDDIVLRLHKASEALRPRIA